jgi:hypothetical protein
MNGDANVVNAESDIDRTRRKYAALKKRQDELERELGTVVQELAALKPLLEPVTAGVLGSGVRGLSGSEATEKLLRIRRKPISAPDLVDALIANGFQGTLGVGRVVGWMKLAKRRFKCSDGRWGLAEWPDVAWPHSPEA